MFLGRIWYVDDTQGIIQEERTPENKHKTDDDLLHWFDDGKVTFVNVTFDELEVGDFVWFSLYKPCGEKEELVDAIKKPIF
jgi:hypothetical protein